MTVNRITVGRGTVTGVTVIRGIVTGRTVTGGTANVVNMKNVKCRKPSDRHTSAGKPLHSKPNLAISIFFLSLDIIGSEREVEKPELAPLPST